MNTDNGALEFEAYINNSRLNATAAEAERRIKGLSSSVVAESAKMDDAFSKIGATVGTYFGLQALASFGREVVNVRGEFQQLGIAFEVMLGSKEKADRMMAEQITFAAKTPYTLTEVATNTKQLMAMGVATEDVMKTMKSLGDVSAGVSVPISRVAINYGQVMTLGKLQGREIRDFAMAGIPIIDELAKMLGKTKAEILDMSEAGQISAQMTTDAFARMSGEGGKFFNMMERQNSSVTGQVSNLKDKIAVMYNEIGTANEGMIYDVISGASTAVEHYDDIANAIIPIALALGGYKAALIAVSAVEATKVAASESVAISGLKQLLTTEQITNAEMAANASKKGLVVTSAERIAALQAEVAATQTQIQVELQLAQVATASAIASHKAALQRAISAKAAVTSAEIQLAIAKTWGTQAEIEIAQKDLLNAREERNIATKARKATADTLAIAKSKEQAISNSIEAATTNLNTVANSADAVSTNFLTAAKIRLTAATKALWASLASNPYGWLIAAIAAIGYGIYKWATYSTQAEKAQKELTASIESETLSLEIMFDRLKAAKKGTDEYASAKKAIIDKYGQYDEMLNTELDTVNGIALAYEKLTAAVLESAKARLRDKYTKEASDEAAEDIAKQYKKIRERIVDALGKDAGGLLFEQVKEAYEKGGDWQSLLSKKGIDPNRMSGFWGSEALTSKFGKIDEQKAKLKEQVKEFNDIFGTIGEAPAKDGSGEKATSKPTVAKQIEENLKAQKEAIQKLEEMRKSNSTATTKDIDDQDKIIKGLKEQYTTLTGIKEKKPKETKESKDPVKEELEKKKELYQQYYNWLNSKDEILQKAAKTQFKSLLEQGTNYLDYLKKQRDSLLSSGKPLSGADNKKLATINNAIASETDRTVVGDFKDSLSQQLSSATSVLDALARIQEKRKELKNDGSDVDKEKKEALDQAEKEMSEKADQQAKGVLESYMLIEGKKTALKKSFDSDNLLLDRLYLKAKTDEERKQIDESRKNRAASYEQDLSELNSQILKSSEFYARFFEDASRKGYATLRDFAKNATEVIDKATISKGKDGKSYATITIPKLDENGKEIKETIKVTLEELGKLKEKLAEMDADLAKRNPFKKLSSSFKDVVTAVKESESARKESKKSNGGKVKEDDPKVKAATAKVGDALKGLAEGFDGSLAVAQQWGDSLGTILGGGFDEAFKEITTFVKGAGDIGFGIGKIASGDVVGGITQTLSGVAAIYKTITSWQAKQAEMQRKLYLGEIEYQRALRERNLELESSTKFITAFVKEQELLNWLIQKGFVKEGSSSQYAVLGREYKDAMSNLKEEAKAYDDLFSKLQQNGETYQKTYGASLSVSESRTSMKYFTPEMIKQADAQGKLTGATKEWYDAWVKSGEKVEELTGKISEMRDQMSAMNLGSSFDDFLSGVADSLESAKGNVSDFSEFTEATIKKALLSSFKYQILSDAIKPFYDELSEKFVDNYTTDGGIDSAWVDDWSARLQKTMGDDWDKLQKIFSAAGVDWAEGAGSSKTLSGAIQGVTEETAGVLSGQINAMRINQIESIAVLRNSLLALNKIADNTAHNVNLVGILKALEKLVSNSDSLRAQGF